MKLENTVTFTIQLQYCDCELKLKPSDLDRLLFPTNYKQRVWLGQSLGDCIWLWYEFENIEEKNKYLIRLKSIVSDELLSALITKNIQQKDLDYWIDGDIHKNISFDYLTGHKTSRD